MRPLFGREVVDKERTPSAPGKAGRRLEVKVLYPERDSDLPGPRVMGVCAQGQGLSVDRGKCRLSIELRNQR